MRFAPYALRLFDILLAAAALAVLALPMTAIALAIRMSDGAPALFRQQRVGQHGRHFTVLKFRSMGVDRSGAGTGVPLKGETAEEARARFARTEPGDPRITRLGRILRPSHLDELPQLLNILRGDMSFVGVRPDTPVQEGDYSADYWRQRHLFRPGLTGPAQLRSGPVTLAERCDEELKWLNDPSVGRYVLTLLQTFLKAAKRSSF